MSKTYDEIKQMKVDATAYDPTVFDSTRSVLEQLEIIKEYIGEFPTGFVIWGAIEGIDSYVSQISSLSLYPIGRDEDITNPKVGDLVLFRDGTVHLIADVRQSGPSRFTISIDSEVLVNLKGPKGDSVKGDPGIGFNNLSSIDFTYGQPYATFSTDEGMILSGGGRAVLEDKTSFEFATEIEVPFVPGEGITMNADENNETVVISLDPEVSSDLGRAIKQPVLPVQENSVPVVKPDMDIDYVPVSSLGGGGGEYYICAPLVDGADTYASEGSFILLPPESSCSKIELIDVVYIRQPRCATPYTTQITLNWVLYDKSGGSTTTMGYIPYQQGDDDGSGNLHDSNVYFTYSSYYGLFGGYASPETDGYESVRTSCFRFKITV